LGSYFLKQFINIFLSSGPQSGIFQYACASTEASSSKSFGMRGAMCMALGPLMRQLFVVEPFRRRVVINAFL
jgi:hypothetical protein